MNHFELTGPTTTWTTKIGPKLRNIDVLDFDTIKLLNSADKCFFSQRKSCVLLYKLMFVSPRINLYLNSGNYGEDTISNHIVHCYLFPGQCCIRH